MTKIAILCPTRGRPEQCRRMIQSVEDTATYGNVDVILGPTIGDEIITRYGKQYPICGPFSDGMPTVYKWNLMADYEKDYAKLFMLAADDIIFETPGWDKALIEHYNALENKIHVYHLADSRDPNGTPHPIVTREYIDAMGYMLPPIFLHWYVDTWTCAIASANGVFTHLKDFLLTHDKPSDRGQPDETHSRIRRMGWHERDAYVNDTCGHFLKYEKHRLGRKLRGELADGIPDYSGPEFDDPEVEKMF